MFCPKCGSLLMPKKVGKKTVLACSCGFKKDSEGKVALSEAGKKSKPIEIIDKEEKINVIIDAECPKCGYRKAEYWEIQTRSADEPATRFHKCIKCGHTWREYS